MRIRYRAIIEELTGAEEKELEDRIENDERWNAFLQGWSAALGIMAHNPWLARLLAKHPEKHVDTDLTLAVSAVLLRSGHDPSEPPSAELVTEIHGLLELYDQELN